MTVEAVTYISDLNATYPAAGDSQVEGDDHIRNLKTGIKATFPNIAGAVTPTHTELNYVDGVTSAIQTQINTKGAITGQTWTGTHAFASTTSIGNVSATEIAYLDGVTSAIQTQIDAKGAITGQTWTGTHVLPSTTSIGNVSATEIAYLDGVTSALQTQLDAKAPLASPALTGTPTAPTAAVGTNTTQVATTAFVIAEAFSAALPAAALGFVRYDGSSTAFSKSHTGYAQKEVLGAAIASAATINLSTATGNTVHITGSTGPITDITIDSGAKYTLILDSTPTFTHNASKIICPTGANMVFPAGTSIDVVGDGANLARIVAVSNAGTTQSTVSASQLDKTSNTTLANIPNLTATLIAGATYRFKLVAFTTLGAAGSAKFGFNGGTATATSFVASTFFKLNSNAVVSIIVTAISSTLSNASVNATMVEINGTIVCNAGGTFIPQFAQETTDVGTCSVLVNSTLTVDRIS